MARRKKLNKNRINQLGTIFTVKNFNVYQGKIEEEDRYPMRNTRYPRVTKKGGVT